MRLHAEMMSVCPLDISCNDAGQPSNTKQVQFEFELEVIFSPQSFPSTVLGPSVILAVHFIKSD